MQNSFFARVIRFFFLLLYYAIIKNKNRCQAATRWYPPGIFPHVRTFHLEWKYTTKKTVRKITSHNNILFIYYTSCLCTAGSENYKSYYIVLRRYSLLFTRFILSVQHLCVFLRFVSSATAINHGHSQFLTHFLRNNNNTNRFYECFNIVFEKIFIAVSP